MLRTRCVPLRGLGLLALTLLFPAAADAAGLLVAEGGFGGQLKLTEQNVRVVINNGIAVTHVDQVFQNQENRIVEALYTFPVPSNASVSNFSMWIGGKEVIGEVVEKKRARQIYESYKQTKRDPGLLEQVDFKRFEMRIFPIAANAEQRVRITYYQELDFDHDWAHYVYPLATTADGQTPDAATEQFSIQIDVKSPIAIAAMKSPSHGEAANITAYNEHLSRASLELTRAPIDRDFVIAYQVKRPFTGIDLLTSKTDDEPGYVQLTLTVGEELESANPGMDYVFVMDVSGSMATDDKLSASLSSVASFVEALAVEDRFELITFNDMPRPQFGQLAAVNDETLQRARTMLKEVRAKGSTLLTPAVEAAYRYRDVDRPLNVVVLSDGMTEDGASRELMRLIGQRPAGTRVFAIGVGNEVNRPLLRDMAKASGGLSAFLSRGDDFDRQAAAFRRKLIRPAIEEVTIQSLTDTLQLGDERSSSLYHGKPLRVYGRYTQSGPVSLKITGTIMGSPFEKVATVTLPDRDDANPEIERMWAWNEVQQLMSQVRARGETSESVAAIVDLCERYSIVSQYASFIVLENDQEYRRWKIEQRNAVREQRDRRARDAVNARLEQMRSRTLASVGPNAIPTSAAPIDSDAQPTIDRVTQRSRQVDDRSFDLGIPTNGGGQRGGGALDPLSGSIALALGAMGWARRKQK